MDLLHTSSQGMLSFLCFWSVIYVSPFVRTVRSVNDSFPYFFMTLSKNLAKCSVISREIAKITGNGHEMISQFRTEVICDSVKC